MFWCVQKKKISSKFLERCFQMNLLHMFHTSIMFGQFSRRWVFSWHFMIFTQHHFPSLESPCFFQFLVSPQDFFELYARNRALGQRVILGESFLDFLVLFELTQAVHVANLQRFQAGWETFNQCKNVWHKQFWLLNACEPVECESERCYVRILVVMIAHILNPISWCNGCCEELVPVPPRLESLPSRGSFATLSAVKNGRAKRKANSLLNANIQAELLVNFGKNSSPAPHRNRAFFTCISCWHLLNECWKHKLTSIESVESVVQESPCSSCAIESPLVTSGWTIWIHLKKTVSISLIIAN